MKTFVKVALLLFLVPSYVGAQELDPTWLSCSTEQDCVLAFTGCGLPTSVNKEYAEEFKKYVAKTGTLVRCARPCAEESWIGKLYSSAKGAITCHAGVCRVCLSTSDQQRLKANCRLPERCEG